MTYETFKKVILQHLQEDIPDPKEISIHPVFKNNGLILDGLVIMENQTNISPTLYLNYYYESYQTGSSFHTIYEAILETYQENKPSHNIDINFFTDFRNVQSKIVFKLINFEKNRELLQDVPYIPYLDLAIVFYCLFTSDNTMGNASVLIHNSHLTAWETNVSELYDLAMENTKELLPPRVRHIDELLRELAIQAGMPEELADFRDTRPCNMHILSNKMDYLGACNILYGNILKKFADECESDFYIIPSSIHEVILVPLSDILAPQELASMIREVNSTQLHPDEVLSYHPYYYSRVSRQISLYSITDNCR